MQETRLEKKNVCTSHRRPGNFIDQSKTKENQHTLSGNFPGYPEHSVEEMDHQPNWKNSGHVDDSP